jgi:hypothetical protein
MQKLIAVYAVAVPMFCIFAFEGLSALTGSQSSFADENVSKQTAECVLSILREQERAREADKERFVRAMSGVPMVQVNQIMSMLPPPPTVAEAEHARNQALARIKEICRLRGAAAAG